MNGQIFRDSVRLLSDGVIKQKLHYTASMRVTKFEIKQITLTHKL